ncbi:MAG: methyltransferase [Acidimicrobiales bacterium]
MTPNDQPTNARGHYFDASPATPSSRQTVELALPDLRLTLVTDRGVFSADRVDAGSKLLLLDGPPANPSDSVLLDIGAGYGPIACALARRNPQATVYAVEVNERARELCRENAGANRLDNVIVVAPDDVPGDLAIDRIWSNPPIRVGKQALHELLLRWLAHLAPGGSAHLVVQKHLGADSLARWLDGQGYPTVRRSSRKAFRLLDVAPRTELS